MALINDVCYTQQIVPFTTVVFSDVFFFVQLCLGGALQIQTFEQENISDNCKRMKCLATVTTKDNEVSVLSLSL